MNNILYNLLLHTVAPPVLTAYYLPKIVLGRKYRRSLGGKLGRFDNGFHPEALGRPRLWFHAVSVGEVTALEPVIRAVRRRLPAAGVVVSTGTETGRDKARDVIGDADGFCYLPLDYPVFVNRALDRIEPNLFVLVETELWPNLIDGLSTRGVPTALVNGRISDRSFPRYRRLRRFFRSTLDSIDLFLMSSELDADRIREMGAAADRVVVTGNTKFDALPSTLPEGAEKRMRTMLDVLRGTAVLVAGSTHPGENEIVLDAYRRVTERFPDLLLVIVPRHVEKTPRVLAAMKERNMPEPFLRSSVDSGHSRNGRRVIVVDKTGELFQVFSLASVVFMGGSLVSKGGQNILEPAAWGKVVLFGPSMEDFRDARETLIRADAGVEVHNADDLAHEIEKSLADPASAENRGRAGREAILKHVGSAEKNAELLTNLIR